MTIYLHVASSTDHHNSSSASFTRELFKPSQDSASLQVCNLKIFGFLVFCEWRHKWGSFLAILAHVTWPRGQPLEGSILLKFSLETRLESEFFEPLIDFLAFLVQRLWPEINKIFDYLISRLLFLGHNFWTQNPRKSSEVSKESDLSLVSNKNLSEILPSSGLGLDEVGQKGLNLLHLCHSQKNDTQNQKIFFHCRCKDLQVFWGFE